MLLLGTKRFRLQKKRKNRMTGKPVLLLTRKLPNAVEERAKRDYQVILNDTDTQYLTTDLISKSNGVDAMLICSTECFNAEVINGLNSSVKAIATFSVGFEHIDLQAAKKRNIITTNRETITFLNKLFCKNKICGFFELTCHLMN